MFAVLHAGLAKKHRANPAAALRVEAVYGIAVLLSGLACLVLSNKEEKILDQYYKVQGPYTEDTQTASSHPCPCSFPPSRVSPSPCPVAPENVFPVWPALQTEIR